MTAGEYASEELAQRLSSLACAGLHGLVVDVRSVLLNGRRYSLLRSSGVTELAIAALRPPPDARVEIARRHIESAARELSKVLGMDARNLSAEDAGLV